jgi:hypothetical protein
MTSRALLLVSVLTTGPMYAFGQTPLARVPDVLRSGKPVACYAVQPGDTAAGLAQRFTGSPDNRHRPWFHIVNPATTTTVKKTQYDAIQSGWHVCVPTEMLSRPLYAPVSSSQSSAASSSDTPARGAFDVSALWWVVPLCVLVSGLVFAGTGKYVGHRRAVVDIMSGFGNRFVSEFERPLFRRTAGPAIASRLRLAPARHRLEILLAPAAGRRYPNLDDHKRNVEYDVERVLQLLKDESFTCGPPHAEGRWVVIPFHFDIDRQQEGGS